MDEDDKKKRIKVTSGEQTTASDVDTTDRGEENPLDTTSPSFGSTDTTEVQTDDEEKVITIEVSSDSTKTSSAAIENHHADKKPEMEDESSDDESMAQKTEIAAVPMVETEIEPETVATSLVEQEPATVADRPSAFTMPNEEQGPAETAPVMAPVVATAPVKAGDRKRLVVMLAVAGLVIVAAALAWLLLVGKKDPSTTNSGTDTTVAVPIEQPKLGIAATITDGIVEYMQGDTEWKTITDDISLSEGDSVRTGEDSRAVLTLDDGSAIRLDANTTIKLTSLTANQVQVEHLDGIAYSRVVPSSERTYTILIDDTQYQALGTAFTTVSSDTENGVQVFESSVKVNGLTDVVAEGKQFFQTSNDEELEGSISSIDIDELVDDRFINWNVTLDTADNNFKGSLGVLPQIKMRAAALEKAAAKKKAAEEAAKKKAAEEAAAKAREAREKEAEANVMTLEVAEGNLLKWSYLGTSTNGFKLVYSDDDATPVFKENSSQYISDANQLSGRLSSPKLKGKYYVRVCAYTKESTCINYSNVVIIDI